MTQSMKRWMLAAVIAAVVVIASAGMGAADQIVYNFDPDNGDSNMGYNENSPWGVPLSTLPVYNGHHLPAVDGYMSSESQYNFIDDSVNPANHDPTSGNGYYINTLSPDKGHWYWDGRWTGDPSGWLPGASDHVGNNGNLPSGNGVKVYIYAPWSDKAVVAVIGDNGPAPWTGRQFGASNKVFESLGLPTSHRGFSRGNPNPEHAPDSSANPVDYPVIKYDDNPYWVEVSWPDQSLQPGPIASESSFGEDPRITNAIVWAENKIGSTEYYHHDQSWCQTFVGDAYRSTGSSPTQYASAKAAADALDAKDSSGAPPRGAYVFYKCEPYGHVGISVGDGKIIHVPGAEPIRKDPYTNVMGLPYIGWAYPSVTPPLIIKSAWEFGTPHNKEGWLLHNINGWSVENDGIFRIDPAETDPWIESPTLAISADDYNAIQISMASNAPDGNGAIYFKTSADPEYSDTKKVVFSVNNNGNFRNYAIYMGQNPEWTGMITGIRIDPCNGGVSDNSDSIGFDFIRLTKISWEFNNPTDKEGWLLHNIDAWSVENDGIFRIDPAETDPWIESTSLLINADNYNAIQINMASNAPDGNGAIYFKTSEEPEYSETKKVAFSVINNGNFNDYKIIMNQHPIWTDTITGIRIDPSNGGGSDDSDSIGFDFIRFTNIPVTNPSAQIFTSDADFDEGVLVGLEHDSIHDQLQLTTHVSTDPIMWIANAGEDTISKWDTENNVELARYHTWFGPPASHDAWSGPSPSRTAVDGDGNGYVANRHFDGKPADVIKILAESWIDRNGNGVMDTSYDANNDGRITPDEMLPMTDTNGNGKIDDDEIQDERIAWVVSVGPAGGLGRSLAIDTNNNIWLGLYNTRAYYKISGVDGNILAGPIDVSPNTPYGALVDKNEILWGASLETTLLKLDTNTNTKLNVYSHSAYGYDYGIAIGYDGDGNTHVYQAEYGGNAYIEFDSNTEIFSIPAAIKYPVLGIATDSSGNIVASNYNTGAVTKFAPDGSVIWSAAAQVSSEARGTVVDSDDNIWVIHRAVSKLSKFDGSDGTPLGVFNAGLYPYTYSDATGLSLRGSMGFGTWTVIYDSESAGTSWGRVSWNSDVPAGANIDVQIRTGETEEGLQLATYQPVSDGNDFSATGRYIQIKTRLTASPTKESPILYDLTVEPITENSVSGTKFNDLNGNGIRDADESGVSGVSIRLIRMLAPGVESFVSSTTTDGNGYYNFMGLQPGAYKIEEELSGFARSQTFPADGSPHYINFEGTAIEGLDFGNQPIAGGEISGTKFNDSNGNGVQDIGELGISGVKICLWPSSRYTTTDESGNYIFPDVPVSTQTVYEIVPSGYASTTPSMVSVTVNTGEVEVVNFGNRILIPLPPDITVSGATVVGGVPQVFNVNPVVIQKDLAGISSNVVAVKLTLEWGDGTTRTIDMAEIDDANIWQATFSPPFPQGAAQMTFEVDVDPAGNWPGPEDAIQIGDIVFLDPSGQIFDTYTGDPIDGATVTLLVEFPPTSGIFIESPPGNQLPPTNPQITGADGMYGWMTVPGNYKVRAEKAGYISAESIVVNIPPPVTGLDIGLTCLNQPPVAIDKEVNTDEDAPLLGINVIVGCTDPDGDTLSVLEYDDTSTTGLVTFNVSDGTFDYDPDDQFEYLNGGETATDTFTFTISDGEGGTDTATVTITINGVNDAPEISLSNSMGTVQYSDGIEEFTISATDVDSSSLTLSTRWAKDGGTVYSDLPAGLVLNPVICTIDPPLPATCIWTIERQALVDAGEYEITFNVTDGENESEAYTTLVVEPEDAAVAFDGTNPVAVQVAEPGGNSEAFSLTVDVTEAMPDLSGSLLAYPGDISLAEVSVSLVPVGPGSPAEPTSCSLEVVGTGYDAILTLTFGFNDVAVNTYAVQVTVDGGYYTGSGGDVVVIYDPSLGFTTGGGTFLWPETGEKTNFGYTMKYNKKATNIQGNLLLVRHLQDGTIYRVKSNALYGLALGESEDDGETYGWASFSGKSTYLEPGWDEPIGNYEFITYVEDRGEPGKNIDRIWIKIMNLGNTVNVMSMDDPGADNAVELSGGNIVVPHNANR